MRDIALRHGDPAGKMPIRSIMPVTEIDASSWSSPPAEDLSPGPAWRPGWRGPADQPNRYPSPRTV
jgi:hypothetical protein